MALSTYVSISFVTRLHNIIFEKTAEALGRSFLQGLCSTKVLEQACDVAILVNVHVFSGGLGGQTWHGHNIPCQTDQKACTQGRPHIGNSQRPARGHALQFGIIGNGMLSFGHTHGQVAVSEFGEGTD